MSWIRTVPAEDANPELAELYAAMADPQSGQVDNVLQIHSLHPAGLRAHFAVYASSMAGTATLRKVDREMIAVVVSTLNGCPY